MDPALLELYAEGSPDDEVAVIIRLSDPSDLPGSVRIIARFGSIATCRLPRRDIPAVRTHVQSMKAPKRYSNNLAYQAWTKSNHDGSYESQLDLQVIPSDQRRPEADLPTGKGVVVAHIDWGLDFAHPEFRKDDGRTRLLAFWDQNSPMNPHKPNRYGYGRIFSANHIDEALAASDPYHTLGYNPADSDQGLGSHGTHTLSISAGNGRGDGPIGLAPETDLIFVHFSTSTAEGPTLLGDSVALLEALDFIAEAAGSRPFVVNMSLGRQAGQHDGKTLTEQGMDAFLVASSGRAIVQSAGNYYNRRIHVQGTVRPGQARSFCLITEEGDRTPNEVDLWYPGIDRLHVALRGPDGVPTIRVGPGEHKSIVVDGHNVGRLYHRIGDPNNNDNQVVLFLEMSAPFGEWKITLEGHEVVDGRFHAWVERDAGCRRCQAQFAPEDSEPTGTLGTICNGLRTIAVGAYDAHDDARPLAPFSSAGPTRDGRERVAIGAPGCQVLAARSRPRNPSATQSRATRMSGTSMAAPHVTGTVALMFAAAGRPISVDEVRRILFSNTDPPPDDSNRLRIGNGYLNTVAAVQAAQSLDHERPHDKSGETELFPHDSPSEVRKGDAVMTEYEPNFREDGDAPCQCRKSQASNSEYEAENESRRSRLFQSRGQRVDALPFQFQVPLGGGAPSVAFPIGGPNTPFAFSVPLTGSQQTPVQTTVVNSAGPISSPSTTPTRPTSPSSGDEPVTVASLDAPLYEPPTSEGQSSWKKYGGDLERRLVEAAEACVGEHQETAQSSATTLRSLLVRASAATVGESEDEDVLGVMFGNQVPTATTLFNTMVQSSPRSVPRNAMDRHYVSRFEVVAHPNEPLSVNVIREGDLFLRIAQGEGWGHVGVIASPEVCLQQRLAEMGWRSEGYPLPLPGQYIRVIETSPRPRRARDRFARRISDESGYVLPDTLILRLRQGILPWEESEPEPSRNRSAGIGGVRLTEPSPILRRGTTGNTVREIQRQLNRIHADSVALGLPGLSGCPLVEDGHFDHQTEQAVLALQQQIFGDPAKWDGVVGAETRKHLAQLTGIEPERSQSRTASPQREHHRWGHTHTESDFLETACPVTEETSVVEQVAPTVPDSPLASRFIAAHASRFCTPGQAGSATCRGLVSPRSIRRVVIHVLAVPSTARRSGAEAVIAGWQNAGRQASAHYIVDRDGTTTQMVREDHVAFHCPGNNDDSIGIEHADVCNDPSPLTTQLYERSAALVRDLAQRHGFAINVTTVAGHSQVNPNHGDPGPYWDWEYYFLLLAWDGTTAASRPIRQVAAVNAPSTTPAGWQLQQRRFIANDHCASQRDAWGARFVQARPSPTGAPVELTLVVDEACTYKLSLWCPRVAGANSAVPVDVEVNCLSSPCSGTSNQTVTVDQRSNTGRWNDVAVVTVSQTPAEVKVRVRRDSAQTGWILADAVRLLKIATCSGTSAGDGTSRTAETMVPDQWWDDTRELSETSSSNPEYIRWVQTALSQILGTQLAVDGVWGNETRSAVRRFQQQQGLTNDGVVGAQTDVALRMALSANGQTGRSQGSIQARETCTALDRFAQGSDTIIPSHQTKIIASARRILAEGIRQITITGFASSEGSDPDNLALGQRRADRVARELQATLERMRPGSSRSVRMATTSRGEREQIAGEDLEANRRVTICLDQEPVVPSRTRVFRVTGKSFIARIGSRVGSLDCGIDIGGRRIPGLSNPALQALALATDQVFSEDPRTDRIFTTPPPDNKGYRLFSQGQIEVVHRGNELVSVSLRGAIITDSGKECVPSTGACLQAPPLIIDQPFSTERASSSVMRFRWGVMGRPPDVTEPGFQLICQRECQFIWHQVKGTVDASSGSPVMTSIIIAGSHFPSHRVWIDGVERLTVPQGPFSDLWNCDPNNPRRVR